MSPSPPSPRAWSIAVGYAGFAYALHKVGASLGYYPRFGWFQVVTHFVSASALALLLVRAGQTASLSPTGLLVFVVVGATVGALAWELVEYLGLYPGLHWWGVDDSLLDLTVDAVGVTVALVRHRDALVPPPGPSPAATAEPASGD